MQTDKQKRPAEPRDNHGSEPQSVTSIQNEETPGPILIVEDNEATLEFLRSIVEREFSKFSTITASNGEEALKQIKRQKFLLMLLNLMMPRKTGYEVLCELHEKRKEFPILVISGCREALETTKTSERIQTQEIDYLAKPFSPEELVQKIHQLLP